MPKHPKQTASILVPAFIFFLLGLFNSVLSFTVSPAWNNVVAMIVSTVAIILISHLFFKSRRQAVLTNDGKTQNTTHNQEEPKPK